MLPTEAQTALSSNVADALRLIASWRPDVIVSDISLGTREDGLGIARAARSELGDDVVLIAVSGFASDRDAARSLDAGFDAHVAKPFSAGQLVGAVASARDARA
jgi:CheY-like chemotaxis protein